jgi:cobalt/nickel transport system permease protein
MHISEGVLNWPVLAGGAAIAVLGVYVGLKKLDTSRIPQTAIMASAFFVASLIHVPIGPASMHLLLNGLMGIVLGWACIPAILVALVLQALLFQFGGLTVLGVNTIIMAFPALACGLVFQCFPNRSPRQVAGLAFILGSAAVLGSALLAAAALTLSGQAFINAARLLVLAHLPVSGIEGIITAVAASFIYRIKPEILPLRERAHAQNI